eukprot:233186_1
MRKAMAGRNSDNLSFAEDLWDENGFAAICGRVAEGNKTLDLILRFLKDKINLERNCCGTLNKISKTTLGANEDGTLRGIIDSFVGFGVARAMHHEIMCTRLQEEVRVPFAKHANSITKRNKQLVTEAQKFNKELRIHEVRLSKLKTKFRSKVSNLRRIKEIMNQVDFPSKKPSARRSSLKGTEGKDSRFFSQFLKSFNPSDDLNRLASKQVSLSVEFDECRAALIKAVSSARGFRLHYDGEMKKILAELEKLEYKRHVAIRECLQCYYRVTQSSMEAVLGSVAEAKDPMIGQDTANDVKSFISSHATTKPRPSLPELSEEDELSIECVIGGLYSPEAKMSPRSRAHNASSLGDRPRSQSIHLRDSRKVPTHSHTRSRSHSISEHADQKSPDQMVAEKVIHLSIDALFEGTELSEQQCQTLEHLFKLAHGRAAFAAVLNSRRQSGGAGTGLRIPEGSFDTLARIVR